MTFLVVAAASSAVLSVFGFWALVFACLISLASMWSTFIYSARVGSPVGMSAWSLTWRAAVTLCAFMGIALLMEGPVLEGGPRDLAPPAEVSEESIRAEEINEALTQPQTILEIEGGRTAREAEGTRTSNEEKADMDRRTLDNFGNIRETILKGETE